MTSVGCGSTNCKNYNIHNQYSRVYTENIRIYEGKCRVYSPMPIEVISPERPMRRHRET